MNKKLSLTLAAILFLSSTPICSFGANVPPGYDLNAANLPGPNAGNNLSINTNNPTSAKKNPSKAGEKLDEFMKKLEALANNKNLTDAEEIKKLKEYNQELRDDLNKEYTDPNDVEYAIVNQFSDFVDEIVVIAEDNSVPIDQKNQKADLAAQAFMQKMLTTMLTGASPTVSKGSGGQRNAYLRSSSHHRYSNNKEKPSWEIDQPYYDVEPDFVNPSFERIKEKYHLGNFTGCMQEAEAYVRKNPNDTMGFYYLAMSSAMSGQKENAIKAYEKVIALHDSPLIVKYATNGRNCVMGGNPDKCFPRVNEPDYVYPYAAKATIYNLTPIDPQTLIDKNLANVESKISPKEEDKKDNKDDKNKDPKEIAKDKLTAPMQVFGKQDEELDKFIKAPYGNGLAPELDLKYKQQQLKQIQENMNKDLDDNIQIKNIRKYDQHKTDAGDSLKIAVNDFSQENSITNDPEFIQAQKEMKQLNMMFGNYDSDKKSNNDISDLLPTLLDKDNKMSPEMMQTMVTNSMMADMFDTGN